MLNRNNRLFIIAGNKQEYNDFCRIAIEKQVYPDYYLAWVSCVDVLRGYSNPSGICTGSWKTRPDIKDILYQLRVSSYEPDKIERVNNIVKMVDAYGILSKLNPLDPAALKRYSEVYDLLFNKDYTIKRNND